MTAVFRGWQKTSLIEYPGKVCSVLFTGGCNLCCPFCFNPDLVLRPATLPAIPAREVLEWLEARSGLVSAIAVSGGEPTLHPWLDDFLGDARSRGLCTAVATNGTSPERLESLISAGLVDYVAMDVKNLLEPEPYAAATGTADLSVAERVCHSLRILLRSGVDHELRCTVVPALHSSETLLRLASQLRGAKRLVFQEFRAQGALDPRYRDLSPFPPAELDLIRDLAAPLVGECVIRGSERRKMPPQADTGALQAFNPKARTRRYSVQTRGNVVE